MKIKDIIELFSSKAPLSLSFSAQEKFGMYDNSGLLIDGGKEETPCVVCALDLNNAVVDLAIQKGAKLIITHHPVIFRAIKNIQGIYTKVIKNDITIFSAHLNLDSTEFGIEDTLAEFCGAKNNTEINQPITDDRGFGRIFSVEPTTAESVVNRVIGALNTNKYMFFGDKNMEIKCIGTFCGAGLNESAAKRAEEPDMYISADMQHHVILALLESGKCVLQLTHYASEAKCMHNFCERVFKENNIPYHFYKDERFL